MKLTYGDIADTVAMANEIRKIKLPIRFSLKMAQGIRKAREIFQDFEDIRKSLIEEYDVRQISDKMCEEERRLAEEHNQAILPQLNQKILEALKQEVEIDFEKIKLDTVKDEDLDKLQEIPVNVMEATWWMWDVQ